MPSQISFPRLIEALANAVIVAQQRISQHQINNVRRFFDEDNRPVSVDIRTPSVAPDAKTDEEGNQPEDVHRIPLITLVQSNQLTIKEFDVNFDVTLGDMKTLTRSGGAGGRGLAGKLAGRGKSEKGEDRDGDKPTEARSWFSDEEPDEMSVDPQPTASGTRGPTARISMRVEGKDPPEGMARLIDRLVKTI
jgi:hypothetical protein